MGQPHDERVDQGDVVAPRRRSLRFWRSLTWRGPRGHMREMRADRGRVPGPAPKRSFGQQDRIHDVDHAVALVHVRNGDGRSVALGINDLEPAPDLGHGQGACTACHRRPSGTPLSTSPWNPLAAHARDGRRDRSSIAVRWCRRRRRTRRAEITAVRARDLRPSRWVPVRLGCAVICPTPWPASPPPIRNCAYGARAASRRRTSRLRATASSNSPLPRSRRLASNVLQSPLHALHVR